jgi:hypothetical protein
MRAAAGRDARGRRGVGRGGGTDRLAGHRQRRWLALEEGDAEVLGRALAVLEGRLAPRRIAVIVRVAAVAGRRRLIAGVQRSIGIDREHAAGERGQPARRGSLVGAPVRGVGRAVALLLDRLAPVDQDVEAGDHRPGDSHRREARAGAAHAAGDQAMGGPGSHGQGDIRPAGPPGLSRSIAGRAFLAGSREARATAGGFALRSAPAATGSGRKPLAPWNAGG